MQHFVWAYQRPLQGNVDYTCLGVNNTYNVLYDNYSTQVVVTHFR